MPPRADFLYLSEGDTVAAGVLDTGRCVDVCEDVFRLLHEGDYLMGGANGNSHGLGLPFPKESPFPNMPVAGPDRRFVTMPAYLGGRYDVCGNKWYGSNPANPSVGLPRSVLTLMLNDKSTGEPLALMSANQISAARTGAVPAVATRHLTRPGAQTLAVMGAGAINRACVRAIVTERPPLTRIVCFDLFPEVSETFAAWCRDEFDVEAVSAATSQEAVADADIVSVAASRLQPLRVESVWFKAGTTVLLSGPLQADDAFWLGSDVVYDHIGLHEAYVEEAIASGDRATYYAGVIGGPLYTLIDAGRLRPLQESVGLGAYVSGVAQRVDSAKLTVFVACGMAVFDVAWGFTLYQIASEKGIGQRLDLWGSGPSRPSAL
jgi:ornithine cyclodeaminase/alanine dehydrogenase-like protein (mu-crystallin family)